MDHAVLIGNIISGIGVLFLILGHYIISTGQEIRGLKASILGGLLVGCGAVFLESWPVLALNAFWMVIGLYGLYHRNKGSEKRAQTLPSFPINCFFMLLFSVGLGLSFLGYFDLSAWFCTALYLLAFALFSNQYITNFQYMLWTFLGFFLILEHLIMKQNYSVLFNETIGAVISLKGIVGHLKNGVRSDSGSKEGALKELADKV